MHLAQHSPTYIAPQIRFLKQMYDCMSVCFFFFAFRSLRISLDAYNVKHQHKNWRRNVSGVFRIGWVSGWRAGYKTPQCKSAQALQCNNFVLLLFVLYCGRDQKCNGVRLPAIQPPLATFYLFV